MTKIHLLSTPLSQYLFKLNIAFPSQGFLAADEYQFEYVDSMFTFTVLFQGAALHVCVKIPLLI